MESISNEILLKRSTHASRNLAILAALVSVIAIALSAVFLFVEKVRTGVSAVMLLSPIGLALVAAGYWILAVAARRGSATAVAIVIAAAVANIVIALIAAGIDAAQTKTVFLPSLGGFIIPILVIIALNKSRNVLLELKRRDLWNQVFGSVKPVGQLCHIGGALVIAGLISVNGSSFYANQKVIRARQVEMDHAKEFVIIVQNQEKKFYSALNEFKEYGGKAEAEVALAKVELLASEISKLQEKTDDRSPLDALLINYAKAVHQWKDGVQLFLDPNGTLEEAQKNLQLGDKFRNQAAEAFDQHYAREKK